MPAHVGWRRVPRPATGREFYVDNTGGNDAYSGRSPAAAWKTVAKVNATPLSPGDTVRFKRGETWVGTCLEVLYSGQPGQPITYCDYGPGSLPIIDGNNAVDCVVTSGIVHHITIQDIKVQNGLDFGIIFAGGAHYGITLLRCTAIHCGNDNINFMGGVHDSRILNCISSNPYDRVGGATSTCFEIADGSYNITVEDCTADDANTTATCVGLAIHSHVATIMPFNVTVRRLIATNCMTGIMVNKANNVASPDLAIKIENCLVHDGPADAYGVFVGTDVAQHLLGVSFSDCNIHNVGGFPLYMYSRASFIRCVFQGAYMAALTAAYNAVFNHCTFYRTNAIAFRSHDVTDVVTLANCIVATAAISTVIDVHATTGEAIDWNLYFNGGDPPSAVAAWLWDTIDYTWAQWKTNTGQDANSPTPANPLFTNPATFDFTLQAGSPAIGAASDGLNLGAY